MGFRSAVSRTLVLTVLAVLVGGIEGKLVQNPLHHRLQPPGTDILDGRIQLDRDIGSGANIC